MSANLRTLQKHGKTPSQVPGSHTNELQDTTSSHPNARGHVKSESRRRSPVAPANVFDREYRRNELSEPVDHLPNSHRHKREFKSQSTLEHDKILRKQCYSQPIGSQHDMYTHCGTSRGFRNLPRAPQHSNNDFMAGTADGWHMAAMGAELDKGPANVVPFPNLLTSGFNRHQTRHALKPSGPVQGTQLSPTERERGRRKRSYSGAPSQSSCEDANDVPTSWVRDGGWSQTSAGVYAQDRPLNAGQGSRVSVSVCSSLRPPRKRRRYACASNATSRYEGGGIGKPNGPLPCIPTPTPHTHQMSEVVANGASLHHPFQCNTNQSHLSSMGRNHAGPRPSVTIPTVIPELNLDENHENRGSSLPRPYNHLPPHPSNASQSQPRLAQNKLNAHQIKRNKGSPNSHEGHSTSILPLSSKKQWRYYGDKLDYSPRGDDAHMRSERPSVALPAMNFTPCNEEHRCQNRDGTNSKRQERDVTPVHKGNTEEESLAFNDEERGQYMKACRHGVHIPWMVETIAALCYETINAERNASTPSRDDRLHTHSEATYRPEKLALGTEPTWIPLSHHRAKEIVRSMDDPKSTELLCGALQTEPIMYEEEPKVKETVDPTYPTQPAPKASEKCHPSRVHRASIMAVHAEDAESHVPGMVDLVDEIDGYDCDEACPKNTYADQGEPVFYESHYIPETNQVELPYRADGFDRGRIDTTATPQPPREPSPSHGKHVSHSTVPPSVTNRVDTTYHQTNDNIMVLTSSDGQKYILQPLGHSEDQMRHPTPMAVHHPQLALYHPPPMPNTAMNHSMVPNNKNGMMQHEERDHHLSGVPVSRDVQMYPSMYPARSSIQRNSSYQALPQFASNNLHSNSNGEDQREELSYGTSARVQFHPQGTTQMIVQDPSLLMPHQTPSGQVMSIDSNRYPVLTNAEEYYVITPSTIEQSHNIQYAEGNGGTYVLTKPERACSPVPHQQNPPMSSFYTANTLEETTPYPRYQVLHGQGTLNQSINQATPITFYTDASKSLMGTSQGQPTMRCSAQGPRRNDRGPIPQGVQTVMLQSRQAQEQVSLPEQYRLVHGPGGATYIPMSQTKTHKVQGTRLVQTNYAKDLPSQSQYNASHSKQDATPFPVHRRNGYRLPTHPSLGVIESNSRYQATNMNDSTRTGTNSFIDLFESCHKSVDVEFSANNLTNNRSTGHLLLDHSKSQNGLLSSHGGGVMRHTELQGPVNQLTNQLNISGSGQLTNRQTGTNWPIGQTGYCTPHNGPNPNHYFSSSTNSVIYNNHGMEHHNGAQMGSNQQHRFQQHSLVHQNHPHSTTNLSMNRSGGILRGRNSWNPSFDDMPGDAYQ